MLRLLSKREKIILFFTAGLITFAILFNFLILPVLKKYDTLNKEIRVTRARLVKYIRLLNQKEIIQNKAAQLAMNLDLSGQQNDALVIILTEVESLAKGANIRIVDVRPKLSKQKSVAVDIKTEGDMDGYLNFIYSLQNSLSLLVIDKFRLSAKANSQSLEGNFSISQISSQ
ncbi:MAG: hypothetical protein V1842_01335 [Candidatus Omnitrophota bacterium]